MKILDVSQALFLKGGEEAVTLRGVADAIEYSPTAVYAHFANKAALLDAVCEAQFAYFSQSMQRAERVPEAVGRLRNVARHYVDFGLQNPGHYQLLMRRQALPATDMNEGSKVGAIGSVTGALISARREHAATERPTASSPAEYLQRAVFKAMAANCFKSEYRDVSLLTQILWSCLHGVVVLHSVRAQHAGVIWKPIQSTVDGSLEILINGMLAPAHQIPVTWQR